MTIVVPGVLNEGERRNSRDEGPFRLTGTPGDYAYYEDAGRAFIAAASLWDLLGSENGDRIRDLLYEQIERDDNLDENGSYRISPEQAARLSELLSGLDAGLGTVVDEDGVAYAEHAAEVPARLPNDLYEPWSRQGKPTYSILQTLIEVRRMTRFLQNLVPLNQPLQYG